MRVAYIDKLKGLTMICVVMTHTLDTLGKQLVLCDVIASFIMPTFFFLSGIFALKGLREYTVKELGTFLRKKTMRLLLPFFIIGGLYHWMCEGVLVASERYWFLPTLFYLMLMGLLTSIGSHFPPPAKNQKLLIIRLIIIGILVWSMALVLYLAKSDIPYLINAIKNFPFFLCGILYSCSGRIKRLISATPWVYALCVIIYFFLMISHVSAPFITHLTGPFAIVILMNLFSRYDTSLPNWLAVVGTYTMEIYIFHWFFLPGLPWLMPWLQEQPHVYLDNENLILGFIITGIIVAGVVAAAMGIGVIIRHNPILSTIILGGRFDKGANRCKE